ncbi:helix-turn-helix domain-containing protein [Aeromicrobium sp. YIM 150415]|uniref:helix-turn-helix domain-containing protein n=1 Tax=Aeromicrobium sp. YIM 150415 TaxID=2803912 RepID=UPI001963010E|nr:helix-turn-helix domain-containing protein [Aeromicrobium sp. YIM 150415]MBM9464844.1 helix-turn-helix domain-containing protein [Aeromicrobium sp. YIM 150415]
MIAVGRVSVSEAAEALGVRPQRIHQRIRDGSLPARRIGHQWSIEEADLAPLGYRRRPGRPLSARSAWGMAAAASNDSRVLARLSAPERSRARSRVRDLVELAFATNLNDAAAALAVACGNRARRALFVASVRDLPDLRADDRLRLSGISLPESTISGGEVVEGYVMDRDVDALADGYLLSPAGQNEANVILHVVDSQVEDLVAEDVAESLLIRAADLAEHGGIREREQVVRSLEELRSAVVARGL